MTVGRTTALSARAAAALLALAWVSLPAAPASAERSDANSIHAGAVSLQFLTFGGGFSNAKSSISAKAHFSDRGAVLLGTSLFLEESTGKRLPTGLANVSNERNYSITVSGEIQEYVDARGPVTVFVALGPYWNRTRGLYESNREYLASDSTTHLDRYSSDSRSWQIGATAGIGFEWFFKHKLSLLGRVGANLGFGKNHQNTFAAYDFPDPNTFYTRRLETSTLNSGSTSSALGLAVYF